MIKRSVPTEKSYQNQDKGIWTFVVSKDETKGNIKHQLEELFGTKIDTVNTSRQLPKVRKLKGTRIHTKRREMKIARITLKDKKKKLDLTKLAA